METHDIPELGEEFNAFARNDLQEAPNQTGHFVSRFLRYVESHRPLTLEQQSSLSNDYRQNGQLAAREALVGSHIKFAWKIAMDLRGYGIPEETLKAEAVAKLIGLADTYDPEKGVKFISYIGLPIKGHIQKQILEYHGVPNANRYQSMFFTLNAEKFKIQTQNPGISAVQLDRLLLEHYTKRVKDEKVTLDDIRFIEERLASIHVSLYQTISNDPESDTLIDQQTSSVPGPEEHLEKTEDEILAEAALQQALSDMTAEERKIAAFMYLDRDMPEDKVPSIKTVSSHFGMPQAVIRDIHDSIISKLTSSAEMLKDGTLDYNFAAHPVPVPFLPDLTDPVMKIVYQIAETTLKSQSFFLFSMMHFQQDGDPVSLEDMAEALNISRDEALSQLRRATNIVTMKLPEEYKSSDFYRVMKATISTLTQAPQSQVKGSRFRTINNFDYLAEVLEMTQTYVHLKERIPEPDSPGPNNEPDFWRTAHDELRRRFPDVAPAITVDFVFKTWLKDMARVFEGAYGRKPGHGDGIKAGHPFLTWGKVERAGQNQLDDQAKEKMRRTRSVLVSDLYPPTPETHAPAP